MLGVLTAIEADSERSQRAISMELGVALGLTNAYLKRCLSKGLVKIKQVPRRRYAYYLTPKGFAEKARLSAEFLTSSLQFFRQAREQLDAVMRSCAEQSCRRVALMGVSEVADLAILAAQPWKIQIVGIVDSKSTAKSYMGFPVVPSLADLTVDAVVVTQITDVEGALASAHACVPERRVIVPDLVRIALSTKRARKSPAAPSAALAKSDP